MTSRWLCSIRAKKTSGIYIVEDELALYPGADGEKSTWSAPGYEAKDEQKKQLVFYSCRV